MFGLVCAPISRLSNEPTKKSELQDEVLYGTYVDILDLTINYYLIKTFYNYIGYVKKDDVSVLKTKFNFLDTYNGIITKHYVDVLKEPKFQSYPIISIPRGSYIKILPEKLINGFQAVELINNRKGYIKEDCFKYRVLPNLKEDEDELRNKIVKNALSYHKTQYRWGGKTILGIDCSGLCSMSYLLEEILIYRDVNFNDDIFSQFNMRKINREDLKKGDLIYTNNHIMMYLGNNKFINSSSKTSGVTINSLNKDDSNFIETYEKNIIGYGTVF